jgi:oligopeptide transport system substrate-binding protein
LTRPEPNLGSVPAAAERIVISEDQLTYTFYLRPALWSDGHPVTAHDFALSWQTLLNPSFPSLCSYLLFPIRNAEPFAQGKAELCELGIRALSDQILEVQLGQPTPHFLSLTSFPLLLPIPSHIEHTNPHWEQTAHQSLVVNGPFTLELFQPNSEILLTKNPLFWDASHIYLDGIHISIIPDEDTTLAMFHQGELDWIGGSLSLLSPSALLNLNPQDHLQFIPMAASTFCTFNTEKAPFHLPAFRKAMSLVIDQTKIVQDLLFGKQIEGRRPLPTSIYTYPHSETPLFHTDIPLARQLLKQAFQEGGYTLDTLPPMTLFYSSNQTEKIIAQALQTTWETCLGLSVQLQQFEKMTLLTKLHHRDFQLSLASWIAQFHDPINLLERLKTKENRKNYAGWTNSQYVNLLNQANQTRDLQQRESLFYQAEAILADETPFVTLYHWQTPTLTGPRIETLPVCLDGAVLFERSQLASTPDPQQRAVSNHHK